MKLITNVMKGAPMVNFASIIAGYSTDSTQLHNHLANMHVALGEFLNYRVYRLYSKPLVPNLWSFGTFRTLVVSSDIGTIDL